MTAFGLDVGTSSVKGVAVGEDGELVARAEVPHESSMPEPGWSEQDPEDWWRGAQQVLSALESSAGRPSGIGLSGQMHGLVALDGGDRVLRPAMLWNDQRTADECVEIEERLGGPEGVAEATGNAALTGFTAPKLLWIERNEPEVYGRIESVLLPKDYVRLRLTGEHATDVTDASGTLWFDVARRAWSERMLDALEVDPGWLPVAAESPEATGATDAGVPVAAGAGDQGAGAIGVGIGASGASASAASAPGAASVVLGTSGVVLHALDSYGADPASGIQASAHSVPGRWFAMGVILSAAGSLAWLQRALDAPYDVLLGEAERWEPGCEGLTFLPYLSGERAPHNDPSARGAFVGLSARHDRGALVRSVLEGVAFAMRDVQDLVAGLGGPVEVGRVSGGGARSSLWLRILSSVLAVPLEKMAVEEGAAFGAALLGGVAGDVWGSVEDAVGACVRPASTVEPEAGWVDAYAALRPRFRSLYPALRDV